MTNTNLGGTINDITNLKFYTAKGYEIPMTKSYVLNWELIPDGLTSKYIQKNLSGYFIGDISFDDPEQLKMDSSSLLTQFIENGEIYIRFADEATNDENGIKVFSYNDASNGVLNPEEYYNYVKDLLFREDNTNKIKVSINIKDKSFTHTFDINEIFEFGLDPSTATSSDYADYTLIKTIYTGENLATNSQEFYQVLGLSKIDLVYSEEYHQSFLQQVFESNVPNIGVYFPFVRYAGDFYQEKVSEGFIAADTLLILEEVRNEDDTFSYTTPYISQNSKYSLVFQPSENSEIKIIDSEHSIYDIQYTDEASFAMASEPISSNVAEPFSFTVAFQTNEEGAYQNLLGIYLRSKDDVDEHVFFMGVIAIKTEVEGEDERFRTLLTNFGIPDPVYYSNIFAEQDFAEEGKDYKLINKKSKELMLTYDQIFSYVGTYKALFRAIKFLGYQDIVFKEWYTVRDQNDKLTDIAVQVFDTSNGSYLKQKLASVGVSIEDFKNYNKLNKLSMIYHFNEKSDDVELLKSYCVKYNPSTGNIENIFDGSTGMEKTFTFIKEIPTTKPIFAYRNEETLTKLLSVKKWLEQHIIGVGAYIADITGEGIYFGWQKTQGYSTIHHLSDFSSEQYYTPDVKVVLPFINSKGKIACTLNELNDAVRFVDYVDTPFDAFDKFDVSVNLRTDDGTTLDISTLTITNSIEAPVLGDEYEFDLFVKPDSGTLYEWTAGDASSAQILIQDGEIKLLKDTDKESYIDSSCLPIITLENANIHKVYGQWRSNIKWLIREYTDATTGNVNYKLQNYNYFLHTSNQKTSNNYFVLKPVEGSNPYIKYSENNKWDIPMFIIHGYKFEDVSITSQEAPYYNLENDDYILEVIKGDFLFKDVDGCGCQLSFSADNVKQNDNDTYLSEQEIQPIYTYHSERKPFINFDSSIINASLDTIIDCSTILAELETDIRNSLNQIQQETINTISSYTGGFTYRNPALVDAQTYQNTSSYIDDVSAYISIMKNAKKQELLSNYLNQVIDDNYECNKTIDVEITRLGKYELISRAYDKYNNMFVAKYDNTINVQASPISIDTYISNSNSNNTESFYRYNINGELQDGSQVFDLLQNCDSSIKFSKTYHIYDTDYNLQDNYLEFDNISYALDTPKNNDTIIFSTLNEKCVNMQVKYDTSMMSNYTELSMLDENPNKIFLYANVGDNIQKTISVFAYDQLTRQITDKIENASVISTFLVDQKNDVNFESDSYIRIYGQYQNLVTNNNKVFVLNTTEYPLIPEHYQSKDSSIIVGNTYMDIDNKETYITFDYDQVFNNEDVVKVRYRKYDKVGEQFIINETAYRIKSVQGTYDEESEEFRAPFTYVLNGLINENMFNAALDDASNNQITITYVAEYPVMYATKVRGNAYEFNQIIGYSNYSLLRDHLVFDTSIMFLKDYIDDTFGIEVNDYDYSYGEKYWKNFQEYIPDASIMTLYKYHQFPITAEQGYNMIFAPNDEYHAFLPGYKVDWNIKLSSVDELINNEQNINVNNKEILFRSINNQLCINPYMLGSHDVQLTCTDIYGNRLVNNGEGLLYVKENKDKSYFNYSYV